MTEDFHPTVGDADATPYPNDIDRAIHADAVAQQKTDASVVDRLTKEIRTTSSTGGEKGVKPQRHSLLPKQGLDAISEVFGFGASKYAAHNWRRGYEWSKSYDALIRHLAAFWDGETYDEESGLPHLAHAGFHILVLLTWLDQQGEGAENPFDDRWPADLERIRRAAEQKAAEEREAKMGRAMSWLQDYDAEHVRADMLRLTALPSLQLNFTEVSPETMSIMLGIPIDDVESYLRGSEQAAAEEGFGPDLLSKRPRVDPRA